MRKVVYSPLLKLTSASLRTVSWPVTVLHLLHLCGLASVVAKSYGTLWVWRENCWKTQTLVHWGWFNSKEDWSEAGAGLYIKLKTRSQERCGWQGTVSILKCCMENQRTSGWEETTDLAILSGVWVMHTQKPCYKVEGEVDKCTFLSPLNPLPLKPSPQFSHQNINEAGYGGKPLSSQLLRRLRQKTLSPEVYSQPRWHNENTISKPLNIKCNKPNPD